MSRLIILITFFAALQSTPLHAAIVFQGGTVNLNGIPQQTINLGPGDTSFSFSDSGATTFASGTILPESLSVTARATGYLAENPVTGVFENHFTVAAGSLSFDVTSPARYEWDWYRNQHIDLSIQFVTALGDEVLLLNYEDHDSSGTITLATGSYGLNFRAVSDYCCGGNISGEMTFSMTAVPLPPSILLFASALLPIGPSLIRRLRSRS